jgi:hypothetical protein
MTKSERIREWLFWYPEVWLITAVVLGLGLLVAGEVAAYKEPSECAAYCGPGNGWFYKAGRCGCLSPGASLPAGARP